MIIKPSIILRKQYAMISELAHETGEPIYITKNGNGDLVVLSVEAYEEQEELWRLHAQLEATEQPDSYGETAGIAELRSRLRRIYKNSIYDKA